MERSCRLWQVSGMRPPQPERPRLRKREIVFALAAGTVAAGGASLILFNSDDDGPPAPAAHGSRTMTYQIADFDEISTSGPQDVVVTRGDTFAVRAEGSPEALAWLKPVVANGRLTIEPRDGFNWMGWQKLRPATFYVTLPRLDAVAVAGSGDISVDRIEGESFEATIAGPGSLAIASMDVKQASFSIGASGDVTAAGTAGDTHVSIGGSGEVQAGRLRSQTASVSIAGSGDVALTVEEDAKVSIAGSGNVDIAGPAHCSVTQMGSGDVRCSGGGGTENDDS